MPNAKRIKTLNQFSLLGILIVVSLLGCVSRHDEKIMPPSSASFPLIDEVQFTLPHQLKWSQSQNIRKNGQIVAEWVIVGRNSMTTPVSFAYQRLVTPYGSAKLLQDLTHPYRKQCSDVIVTPLKLPQAYPNKAGLELICAKFGKTNYGLIAEIALYEDQQAKHLLLSEVKMPASEKAGELVFTNAEQQQTVKQSQALFQLMQQTMNTVKICDINKQCY